MGSIMKHIIRPCAGNLALMDDATLVTYGSPDAEFWEWLHSSGNYDAMTIENPARMARVEANGVGCLRNEKEALLEQGFTIAEIVSKRPIGAGPGQLPEPKEKPEPEDRMGVTNDLPTR